MVLSDSTFIKTRIPGWALAVPVRAQSSGQRQAQLALPLQRMCETEQRPGPTGSSGVGSSCPASPGKGDADADGELLSLPRQDPGNVEILPSKGCVRAWRNPVLLVY